MKTTASRASAVSQTRGFGDLLYDKAGARPSLDLDFAGTSSLRDKITGEHLVDHTRASVGTYINSEGLVKEAPKNILLYSANPLGQWNKGINTTVTENYGIAPDGNQTAHRIEMGNVGNTYFRKTSVSIEAGKTYTFSVWMKKLSQPNIQVMVSQHLNAGDNTQTLTDTWHRYSYTFTASSSTSSMVGFDNGTNQVDALFWHPQLEEGSVATDYIKTTNVENSAPRFTHERVETGNLHISGNLSSTTGTSTDTSNSSFNGFTNVDVQKYAALAPDGTFSAVKISSNTNTSAFKFAALHSPLGTTDNVQIKTLSCFLKAGEETQASLFFSYSGNLGAVFNLTGDGSVAQTVGSNNTARISKADNGWYRCEITNVNKAVEVYRIGVINGAVANSSAVAGNGIYAWGFQVEEGDAASAFVPSIDTFTSRATTGGGGTYIDSAGLIKTAPINLLTQSVDFNSGWIANFSRTTGFEAPDGTQTAVRIQIGTGASKYFKQQLNNLTQGKTYTFSIHIKKHVSDNQFKIIANSNGGLNQSSDYTYPTEWTRYSVTFTADSGSNHYVGIDNPATGNAVDVLVWGAQLEVGDTATEYIKTYGTASGAARYSHDPETLTPTGLYLEPQGVNYAKTFSSQEFTYSDVIAPDGSNTFFDNPSASTTKFITAGTNQYTPANGQTVTVSYWAKYRDAARSNHTGSGRNKVRFMVRKWGSSTAASINFLYDITTQTMVSSQTTAGTTTTFKPYPNGWYRVSHTFVTDSAFTGDTNMLFYQYQGGATAIHADLPYVWGFQYEVGSYATAYIPNALDSTSSVTRAADVYTSTANLTETFEPRGLLIEEARANTAQHNINFNQWTIGGATLTADDTIAPDGTQTADKFVPNSGSSSTSYIYQSNSLSGTITCSLFVKSAGLSHISLISEFGNNTSRGVSFDLTNGTIQTSQNANGEIIKFPNGWYRIIVKPTSGSQNYFLIQPHNGGTPDTNSYFRTTHSANGTDGMYLWGAQSEVGAFATSFIPNTSGSSVNRSPDIASISGDNFGTYRTNKVFSTGHYLNPVGSEWEVTSGHEVRDITTPNTHPNPIDGRFNAATLDVVANTNPNKIKFVSLGGINPTTHTFSVYVKAISNPCRVQLYTNPANNGRANFNLTNGTAESVDGTSTIEAVGNGWYRVSWSPDQGNTSGVSSINLCGSISSNSSHRNHGNGSNKFYFYGFQVEEGSLTNFIPSTDTFTSRQGNATYVDSNGLIKTSWKNSISRNALVSGWTLHNLSRTENIGESSPFGTTEGVVRVSSSTIGENLIYRSSSFGTAGTLSIYAKAEQGYTHLFLVGQPTTASDSASVNFDLVNGTITNGTDNSPQNATGEIIDVGNGWYRCILRITNNASTDHFLVGLHEGTDTIMSGTGRFSNTTGSSKSALLYGPVYTNSLTEVGEYHINTGTSQLAPPRYSHDPETLVPTGLYLEPAATNAWVSSNLNSSHTDTYTNNIPGGYTYNLRITPNATTAPDGTETAALVVPREDVGANQNHWFQRSHGQTLSTFSVFLKYNGWRYVSVRNGHNGNGTLLVDLLNGTIVGVSSNTIVGDYKIEAYPNGWYRVSSTLAASNNGWSSIVFYENETIDASTVLPTHTSAPDGVSGIYIWGLQVETTRYPSSVIITNGTSVTRPADTYTSTATTVLDRKDGDQEAVLSSSGVSFYSNHNSLVNSNNRLFNIRQNTTSNSGVGAYASAGVFISYNSNQNVNGVVNNANRNVNLGIASINEEAKIASNLSPTSINGSLNGGNIVSSTHSGSSLDWNLSSPATISGYHDQANKFSGTLDRLTIWNKAIPNASLINITT